jgi:hypothetical protein
MDRLDAQIIDADQVEPSIARVQGNAIVPRRERGFPEHASRRIDDGDGEPVRCRRLDPETPALIGDQRANRGK